MIPFNDKYFGALKDCGILQLHALLLISNTSTTLKIIQRLTCLMLHSYARHLHISDTFDNSHGSYLSPASLLMLHTFLSKQSKVKCTLSIT